MECTVFDSSSIVLIVGIIVGVFFPNLIYLMKKLFKKNSDHSISLKEIKKRTASIIVYALSIYSEREWSEHSERRDTRVEFVFLSNSDADDYAERYHDYFGLSILALPFNSFLDCGRAIRLVPELSQVKHALQIDSIQEKGKDIGEAQLSGILVFQAVGFKYEEIPNKVIPLFLRKEDLERTISIFQKESQTCNIQVFSLEYIIHYLKDCSNGYWNGAVIIAPGLTLWDSAFLYIPIFTNSYVLVEM